MKQQRIFLSFQACLIAGMINAQKILTLDECYQLSRQNYPLVKQRELIVKSKEYSVQNASKGYLPQININGQTTYQSAVTEIPIKIPGITIPQLSKDQYKIYGEISQPLYDGGMTREQKKIQEANGILEEQKLETELYKLKERVNQLYFGVLLIDEQLKLTELIRSDIQNGIKKTEAAIANGTAFRMNADILRAELLKTDQKTTELKANRKGFTDMLSLFIAQPVDESTVLAKPNAISLSPTISRPELQVYDLQSKTILIQDELLKAKNRPRFNAFIQGGYGRPALNFLSNSFEPYYIGGLRLSWSLTGLYTLKKERELLDVSRRNIELQKELFLFNTDYALKQQSAEVRKLQTLLSNDEQIIQLRSGIKKTATAQLENGVISTNDFLRELNAEDQARENKLLHEIQLLMAEYTQQTTIGG